MKLVHSYILLIQFMCFSAIGYTQSSNKNSGLHEEKCTYNGIPLYGKVQIVEHFADFKIEIVEYFADIHVDTTQHFPNECGEWQLVEHFPDFTIQIVDNFGDFTIKYVEQFPGVQ